MLIAALLVHADNIQCHDSSATSKKRVIEKISHQLAANTGLISADAVFDALFDRERLGSTGLGKGVAIPHARVPRITHTIAAMLTLNQPVDFDAEDKEDVDIIFALLVPEDDGGDHLEHLASLVTTFREPKICQKIREIDDANKMFDLLLAIDDD
ncbi:MAG: PTS sugar transporter subunit IIA [Methylophaga sp.]|nr:MAG: PTS sugar transporter subunit IIA [Methylophaga sp.]